MSLDSVFVNPLAAAYQSIGDYYESEKLINDLVGQANAENQMRAGAAQGNQAMTGALAGAGIGAVGLIAAAMI